MFRKLHLCAATWILIMAGTASAQECRQLVITDSPPLDRVVLGEFVATNTKGTKFAGDATLILDDGTEIALSGTRKRRTKRIKLHSHAQTKTIPFRKPHGPWAILTKTTSRQYKSSIPSRPPRKRAKPWSRGLSPGSGNRNTSPWAPPPH